MTKFLSDCLEAPEPFFRHGIRRLELANGQPSTDIRTSVEVQQSAKLKMQQLGLDPSDTTAAELYYILQEKLRSDDAKLVKTLRTRAAHYVSAEGNLVDGMVHALKDSADSKRGYALKSSSFKAIIKQMPPKKAMKQLGYRSLDSFLKHESSATIMLAAKLYEGEQWHARLLDRYKKLQPNDFEDRPIEISQPAADKRWDALAKQFVDETKHNVVSFKELGALILLPLPHYAPSGTATASLSLSLHELNEIRAGGTYLKLCQVRPDFGQLVQTVASDEPHLKSHHLDMSIPWNLIQHYYSRLGELGSSFAEPHMQLEDINWHPIEATMAAIEPAFEFWQGCAHLAVLHNRKPVSFNLLDTAMGSCNQLHFDNRLAHYFQDSLWHELLLRYLRPEVVSDTIRRQLQPQLAEELVLA